MTALESLGLSIFGHGKDLDALQMCARTVLVFVFSIWLIRIAGRRSFGQKSPLDSVTAVLLGATISRAIVGASPLLPTLAAGAVLCVLHRLLGWLSLRSSGIRLLLSGSERLLIKNGVLDEAEMRRALVSEADLLAAQRLRSGKGRLNEVHLAFLERNGQISILYDD